MNCCHINPGKDELLSGKPLGMLVELQCFFVIKNVLFI